RTRCGVKLPKLDRRRTSRPTMPIMLGGSAARRLGGSAAYVEDDRTVAGEPSTFELAREDPHSPFRGVDGSIGAHEALDGPRTVPSSIRRASGRIAFAAKAVAALGRARGCLRVTRPSVCHGRCDGPPGHPQA